MVQERSSNAFDTIRFRGKWWIPDSTEHPRKVPGELTFDVRAGGVLDLDEALTGEMDRIPVIHGEGTKGERITVFNGFSIGVQTIRNSFSKMKQSIFSICGSATNGSIARKMSVSPSIHSACMTLRTGPTGNTSHALVICPLTMLRFSIHR